MDWLRKLKETTATTPVAFQGSVEALDAAEAEYFILLAEFGSMDDLPPPLSQADQNQAARLLAEIETLYQRLHQRGRAVPVKSKEGATK